MISLHYDTMDPYRIYGIEHFIQKYGFPVCFNKESDVNLIYGNSCRDIKKINIRMAENEMQSNVSGYLKIDNEKIPLFEKPISSKNGKPLVTFVDEKGEYPCVVSEGNSITIGFDIFNEVGHILSGCLERFWKSSENKQFAKFPLVEYYEKILFNCLTLACGRSNTQVNFKPFWPDGMKFALCLTHDVDRVKKTFQYITHTVINFKKGKIGLVFLQLSSLLRRGNPYWNFERIMELERKLGVKSTFFFLNEPGKARLFSFNDWKLYWGRYDITDDKIIDVIKKLDREGWEIGVHGSYNSYNDLKRLKEEKNVLEEILGKKVHGISQHYCNFEGSKTWEYQEKVGLTYDSTMGFVGEIGFRWGTCHPFHPSNHTEDRAFSLWELPITIMDNACSYGKRENWREISDILNRVEKCNGVLLLRWHQRVFNEHEFPGGSSLYEKIIETCKEKNVWITNANDIVEWLTTRDKL